MGLIVAMRLRVAKLLAAFGAIGRWLRVDPRRSLPVPPYYGVYPAAQARPMRLASGFHAALGRRQFSPEVI
jgi:hypothetical protein